MVDLDKWGRIGVQMLKDATPKDTGKTADSWVYYIGNKTDLKFENTNGKIVLYLTLGYHLGDTWVEGNDFVTPIIDSIADEIRKERLRDERRQLRRGRRPNQRRR